MTNPLITKLANLAAAIKSNVSADIAKYAPELEAKSHEVAEKLDHWLTDVDAHLEDWGSVALAETKKASFAAYRAAVTEAHSLYDHVKGLTNKPTV